MKLFDWKCPRHGVFESSHPICDALGCDSSGVEKVFIKAPSVRSEITKRTDDGLRRSAEIYRQSDFLTASEGEVAKANNQADRLLWGDDASKVLGRPAGAAVGGVEGKAKPGTRGDDWAPALINAAPNPIQRSELTGVKKQDDKWRGELTQTAAETRERLKTQQKSR